MVFNKPSVHEAGLPVYRPANQSFTKQNAKAKNRYLPLQR
ncbi:hypothetical protein PSN_5461 [Pseudomonas sp. NGC7]